MNHLRFFIVGSSAVFSLILGTPAWSVNPAGYGSPGGEFDIKISPLSNPTGSFQKKMAGKCCYMNGALGSKQNNHSSLNG
jgi:hypothetical protein